MLFVIFVDVVVVWIEGWGSSGDVGYSWGLWIWWDCWWGEIVMFGVGVVFLVVVVLEDGVWCWVLSK